MNNRLQVWLFALLVMAACAFIPSGGLWAQSAGTAPTSAATLDELTSPIALYPDALVVHVLTASQDYDALLSFSDWLERNTNLTGSALQDAALNAGFSEALVALALFPQVIQNMLEKPDWTRALGQAVTSDMKGVEESIQRLRGQAYALGNLQTTPEQVVVVNETIYQIQPANPQVIYVPTYPQTVYVQAAPAPVYSSGSVAGAALVGFTLGVIVADNNNYYDRYDDYWDDREDFYEDRAENAYQNQDQRQAESNQRQSDRQTGQAERQGSRGDAASGAQTSRQSAAAPASRGGGSTASRTSGMRSSGLSGYQGGSATRAQSSRGNSSRASSRGGGGRSGGGRRR